MSEQIARDLFVGRTADGSQVHLDINLRTREGEHQTIYHGTVTDPVELTITGTVTRRRARFPHGYGQIRDDLTRVTRPARGLTLADIAELVTIWDRWHLNAMRAACAHSGKGTCPDTGYKYGSAWLTEHLPGAVEDRLRDIVGKAS